MSTNLIFLPNFPECCMKTKKIGLCGQFLLSQITGQFFVELLPTATKGCGKIINALTFFPSSLGGGKGWRYPSLWSQVSSGGGRWVLGGTRTVVPLPGVGYTPADNQDGCTVRAVCPLRSRRRTFLFVTICSFFFFRLWK